MELKLGRQTVKIEAGELVSYQVDGHEFIHQKGSPGWRNSDTEMFPIIGPTSDADFKVKTPKGDVVQDQHGLLRELSYNLISNGAIAAEYSKNYIANTKVLNSKYPKKSSAKELLWPYDFSFRKSFALSESGLEISFTIEGEEGMPFMLGYHPAFKIRSSKPIIESKTGTISLTEVLTAGNRALKVSNCEEIILKDEKSLTIRTEGFGNFMLWTEVPNMICIEPITFYPYAVEADKLHSGFYALEREPRIFKVFLSQKTQNPY